MRVGRSARIAGMDEQPDENPYRAPQTSSPIARRRLPPSFWLGVVGMAGQFAALQVARNLMPTRWAAYIVGALLGIAFFLAVIGLIRKFRPDWVTR
jgi:hypothetical protein